jgi:glutamyl-Q tRNA(Asp) synthetase
MTSNPYRGRFAPSPTGRLHFGSLVAALGSWLAARAASGTWIIRIEDLDPLREVAGADIDILKTLAAFGLESDEPPIFQSRRTAIYEAVLAKLVARDLAYPCGCSRADLAAVGGVHPERCIANADTARTPAWRVRVPPGLVAFDDTVRGRVAQDVARDVGDFVVRRADGGFAYQLAAVVDDAAQGITDVVRGADLVDSTPRQIVLQELLDLPRLRYLHLPLALDRFGRKLSKHERSLAVDVADPVPALRAALAFLGQSVPARTDVTTTLHDALARFDVGSIPTGATKPAPIAALRKDV